MLRPLANKPWYMTVVARREYTTENPKSNNYRRTVDNELEIYILNKSRKRYKKRKVLAKEKNYPACWEFCWKCASSSTKGLQFQPKSQSVVHVLAKYLHVNSWYRMRHVTHTDFLGFWMKLSNLLNKAYWEFVAHVEIHKF